MKRYLGYYVPGLVAGLLLTCVAQADDLSQAENLYKHTDYNASLVHLDKHSEVPATNFLIARNFFMLGDFKKSAEYLQKITASQPANSEYWDWLGRAYGKRAETGNPLVAPSLASKARVAFEKSVELDATNRDALSDLFDYYLEAPGFLGGGYDKAVTVVEKTAKVDPAEAYFQRAKLAQKRKEYQSAEVQFRKAVSIGHSQLGHLVSLARFLANQGKVRESDAVFLEAQQVAPNEPTLWFARADVLIQEKRNLNEARTLLQKYVKASLGVDDPPRLEAERLLKQVGGV